MEHDTRTPPTRAVTADGESLEIRTADVAGARAVAVVTHPHPLMGGDMDNPVPAGLARGLAAASIAVLRGNFRGVGESTGVHGRGAAECDDARAFVDAATGWRPDLPVIGVGYSFGADVLLALDDPRLAAVVAVAPPLAILPLDQMAAARSDRPTLVLGAEHDQFCDPATARSRTEEWAGTDFEVIPGTDHFLAGGLSRVVEAVTALVATLT